MDVGVIRVYMYVCVGVDVYVRKYVEMCVRLQECVCVKMCAL